MSESTRLVSIGSEISTSAWRLMPVEPTPEIIAAAALAVWPVASKEDIETARRASKIVLMSMDQAPGTTLESLAASLATMAPAYRAMLAAAPAAPAAGLEPVAWMRECSDGGIEGPIMDYDRRIDDTRRKFWTGLVRLSDAAAIIAGLRAEVERLTKEQQGTIAQQAELLEKQQADALVLVQQNQKQAERIAELEREVDEYDAALLASDADLMKAEDQAKAIATAVMTDQVSNDSHALFIAAIRDLAAINEALDCDPDDGGAVPIIEAIDELKARIAAQSAALAKAQHALQIEVDEAFIHGVDVTPQMKEALIAIDALAQPTMFSMNIVVNPAIPDGQASFIQGNTEVGRIVNLVQASEEEKEPHHD